MTQLKEMLDGEARRIDADPEALDSLIRIGERRLRNRRIATVVFAFAVFAAAITLAVGGLGSDRSRPTDLTPAGSFHHNGDIVVRAIAGDHKGAILEIDPATSEESVLPVVASARELVWPPATSGRSTDVSWSPDGARLAYAWSNDIWVLDVASGRSTRIVTCGAGCTMAWSPDGSLIAFAHGDTLALAGIDGTEREIVTTLSGVDSPVWSPDGQRLAFRASSGRLFTVDRNGSHLASLGVSGLAAAWSPDGSRIAYLALDETDCDQQQGCPLSVDVVAADGSAPGRLLPVGRCFCIGFWPGLTWSPDGTQMALVIPGPEGQPGGLYVVDADGTQLRLLREGAWGRPSWQPVP
jgi:Tol biopolymer transport system component